MLKFLLVPDDREFDSNYEAARAVREFDARPLALELFKLNPGDELEVSKDRSFIALSGKSKEFKS